jgi:hypothetical protein
MLETALGVASDLLQLVSGNAVASKFTNDVKQEFNAV